MMTQSFVINYLGIAITLIMGGIYYLLISSILTKKINKRNKIISLILGFVIILLISFFLKGIFYWEICIEVSNSLGVIGYQCSKLLIPLYS